MTTYTEADLDKIAADLADLQTNEWDAGEEPRPIYDFDRWNENMFRDWPMAEMPTDDEKDSIHRRYIKIIEAQN